jgi:hypothetical protein
LDELLRQIQKYKKDSSVGKQRASASDYEEGDEEPSESKEFLSKPKILKHNKFMEDIQNIATSAHVNQKLGRIADEKLRRKFMEKIDRTLHHKNNFFTNRRRPDPLAKQLVNSLEALKDMDRIYSSVFPPSLIFLDNKLKSEQVREFIDRIRLKRLPDTGVTDKNILLLEMKTVSKNVNSS